MIRRDDPHWRLLRRKRLSERDTTSEPSSPRSRCLDEAKSVICGDRASDYGQPEDNFARIATMWNAWADVRQPGPFDKADVAIMLGLMKDARLANNKSHADGWRDKAGYAACGYEVSQC